MDTNAKIANEIREAAGAGPSPQEKILAEAAQGLAQRFGSILATAKGIGPKDSHGKPTVANEHARRQAEAKLRHYGAAIERAEESGDPEGGQAIGVRLATMNRAQRRAFLSDARRAAKKTKRRADMREATASEMAEIATVAGDGTSGEE